MKRESIYWRKIVVKTDNKKTYLEEWKKNNRIMLLIFYDIIIEIIKKYNKIFYDIN